MKTILILAICIFCLGTFAGAAYSQAVAPTKIVVINSFAFDDEKGGINKLIAATKSLNAEFTPVQNELQTMGTRLQTLTNEVRTLQGNPAADRKVIQAKIEEGEKLERELKFKQDDAKARFERRQQAVLGPVMQAVGKGLTDFAKQKGYLLIFDIAKDDRGLLIAIGDDRADVTKEFIAFYNARP